MTGVESTEGLGTLFLSNVCQSGKVGWGLTLGGYGLIGGLTLAEYWSVGGLVSGMFGSGSEHKLGGYGSDGVFIELLRSSVLLPTSMSSSASFLMVSKLVVS